MPVCESMKAVKAPMANSGISRSVMPSNTNNSSPAVAAKNKIPTVNTSRRPSWANARGKKPSVATSRQSRGKSTKLVLADKHRTANTLVSVR